MRALPGRALLLWAALPRFENSSVGDESPSKQQTRPAPLRSALLSAGRLCTLRTHHRRRSATPSPRPEAGLCLAVPLCALHLLAAVVARRPGYGPAAACGLAWRYRAHPSPSLFRNFKAPCDCNSSALGAGRGGAESLCGPAASARRAVAQCTARPPARPARRAEYRKASILKFLFVKKKI